MNTNKLSLGEMVTFMKIENDIKEIIKKSTLKPIVSNIYHKINQNEINNKKIVKELENDSSDKGMLNKSLLVSLKNNKDLLDKLKDIKNNNIEELFNNINIKVSADSKIYEYISNLYDKNNLNIIDLKVNADTIRTLKETEIELMEQIKTTTQQLINEQSKFVIKQTKRIKQFIEKNKQP